jgi:glycosyltransferase involved in cell wall biosynthesis
MSPAGKVLLFDARWIGDHGIGRFAREVRSRIPGAQDFQSRIKPWSAFDAAHLSLRLGSLRTPALFYSPGYSAPLTARVPFIFTIHDLNHIDCAESRTYAKELYYERVMKPACRLARAVLTVSQYSRDRICAWSGIEPSRVVNVSNGVDPIFTPVGEKYAHPRPYVLCMGNRKPHKNEARTLLAFAQVAPRIPHDLIFSGVPSDSLLKLVQEADMSERVHFLGPRSDAELASVYRGAAALLFVSLHEGFGLPVVEAMACGIPVITSNVCALPEVAGNAARTVDPLSVDAIAAALWASLTDNTTSTARVREGLGYVAKYSWERTGIAVRRVIESCLRE